MSGSRVTVREAAEHLGITPEAVRKRVERGTIEYERQQDGRLYVFLDDVQDKSRTLGGALLAEKDQRIADLKDQVAYLHEQVVEEREARRRADTLLARIMDRLPELEAPSEAQEPQQEPAEGEIGVQGRGEQERRPWWQRWFGG